MPGSQPAPVSQPASVSQPAPVSQPVVAPPPSKLAATEVRPTIETRRAPAQQVAANISPSAPAVVSPAAPVLTMPAPAMAPAPASPAPVIAAPKVEAPVVAPKPPVAVNIQPKAPAPAAASDLPVQPKIAAVSEDQRVRDAIARADEHLKKGNFINARALLQDAGRGENGELLVALAETYDPVVLARRFPRYARAGDSAKALELYQRAAAKGSSTAVNRVDALKAHIANPSR